MSAQKKMKHGYHDLVRPEILERVPRDAKRILDLGCGTGALGKALKQRQQCYVEGIELNKEAGQAAEKTLDKIWIDNLNRFDVSFLEGQYDCIVFADILEHLIAPWGVLKKFISVLAPGGCVVASIPNIAHPGIIAKLQKGIFRYEPAGILDITHLRFFTKTSLCQMFCQAGLKITCLHEAPAPGNPIQYIVTAKKPLLCSEKPAVTILILAFNAWDYTRQCIESIKRYTKYPYKIIVIDNGSTDNTARELQKDPEIFNIENSCNLGFAAGFNIGLECVDTPYFVIANSDLIVTTGWLSSLVDHIEQDPVLLALGPRSNYVSGPQIIANVPYKNEVTLQAFAVQIKKSAPSDLLYFPRVVFFCTLFKKEVLHGVGFLDERFGLGNFEDDDYCLRIARKGGKTAIDNTVFVHHYGSTTFKENNIDLKNSLETNKKKFVDKWKLAGS